MTKRRAPRAPSIPEQFLPEGLQTKNGQKNDQAVHTASQEANEKNLAPVQFSFPTSIAAAADNVASVVFSLPFPNNINNASHGEVRWDNQEDSDLITKRDTKGPEEKGGNFEPLKASQLAGAIDPPCCNKSLPGGSNDATPDTLLSTLRWIKRAAVDLSHTDDAIKQLGPSEVHNIARSYRIRSSLRAGTASNRERRLGQTDRLPADLLKAAKQLKDPTVSNNDSQDSDSESQEGVPIGPEYQAELPQWQPADAQHSAEDDSEKWVRDRVWPLEGAEGQLQPWSIPSPVACSCPPSSAGSRACLQLHLRELDQRLKAELKEAYFSFGLHKTGEKYAASWSVAEQAAFASTVRAHPQSSGENFWDFLGGALAGRSRAELVAFYFNVFVLRRRELQNRQFPRAAIDSDDDDTPLHEPEAAAAQAGGPGAPEKGGERRRGAAVEEDIIVYDLSSTHMEGQSGGSPSSSEASVKELTRVQYEEMMVPARKDKGRTGQGAD